MIYTVTLNPALDYILYTEEFVLGRTNRSVKETLYYGGKGINVSAVLTELGVECTALGFIAGFTGNELKRLVKENGLQTDFIPLKKGATRINIKLKGTEETEINAQGPAIDDTDLQLLFQKLDKMKEGDTLVLAGSVPPTLPQDIYEQIAERLGGKGIRLAVDAAGELLKSVLPHRPFLIKPNKQELEGLAGRHLSTEAEIAAAAKELQQMGAEYVLVSLGAEGALLLDQNGYIKKPAFTGTAINTVGAGDSMVAGFLAGIDHGKEYALKLGIAAGCATAFSERLASKEEIFALFAKKV
ncbi:MAG: 1-phosphofructokinase [Clostridia bacterium]|nr:1-phosphofructokinase [Clostridia bacterium]